MNDYSAARAELPRSAYLDQTLRRAWNAAQQRSHRYVTLEHLLLALLDDADAIELLQAVDADIPIIQHSVATAINNNAALAAPGGNPPAFSYKFDNLFAGAFEHAMGAGRKEIDGAFLLVALAKHPESDASAMLAANGFSAQVAQRTLDALLGPSPQPPAPAPQPPPPRAVKGGKPAKTKPEVQRAQTPPRPAAAPDPKPVPPRRGGPGTGDRFMEDMLASVRGILDAESRKDWALAPLLNPAATSPAPGSKAAQARTEPQLLAEPVKDLPRAPAQRTGQAPHPATERNSAPLRLDHPPRPAIASQAMRPPPMPAPAAGFSEPKAEVFDLELPAPPQAQERPQQKPQEKSQENKKPQDSNKPQKDRRRSSGPKAARAQIEPPDTLLKTLESIPRTLRLARGEIVQIRLGKEEAAQLFARPAMRPQPGGEAQAAIRAVGIRLSAPEGGFFIETITPETQWLFDRTNSAGEEPFGSWSWAVVPNETGWRILALSVSVRDIDANGLLTGSQVTEQTIKIRVGTNIGRLLWGWIRALLLLIAGGALALGACYVLKATGKLPL